MEGGGVTETAMGAFVGQKQKHKKGQRQAAIICQRQGCSGRGTRGDGVPPLVSVCKKNI